MKHSADGLAPRLRGSWSLCETVRADLLATLGAVRPSHWARQPGPDRWSVAQQADHLLKAEVGTSKIVRRLIRGDYESVTRPPGAALYDSRLDAYPFGPVWRHRRPCSLRAWMPTRLTTNWRPHTHASSRSCGASRPTTPMPSWHRTRPVTCGSPLPAGSVSKLCTRDITFSRSRSWHGHGASN